MKNKICLWITVLVMSLTMVGCGDYQQPPSTMANLTEQDDIATESNEQSSDQMEETEVFDAEQTECLKITMLDVGQGLSVIAEDNGHYMIYDGGNRKHSSYVVSYLKKHDITNIDYLIASHYDEDHIAGLVGILNTTTVENAIIPNYQTDSDIYNSFMKSVNNANSVVYATTGSNYRLGDSFIKVLYGCDGSETLENNMSTVIEIKKDDFSCILTGDAEYSEENALIESGNTLACTVYVVGHHGSSSSSSEAFVKAMNPAVAFISVGADNSYGHPTEKTLKTLLADNVSIYRTDLQGNISLDYSSGQYSITTEKEIKDNDSNATTDESTSTVATDQIEYVLNNSSKKFHLPDCQAVKRMSDSNKEYSSSSRKNLIEAGYSPCGICNP